MRGTNLLAALLLACMASTAPAQRIAPMLYDLTPTGEQSSQVLRLDNNLTRPITIEAVVYRREIAPDGTEKRTEAGDDFLVFPPQAVIQPNATQSFRVRYVGEPNLDKTRMYVVSFNQLPVSSAEAPSLQFVVNFGTAAYVSPAGVRPEISVASTAPAADGKTLAVTVNNSGRKHASLALAKFTMTNARGQSFDLEGEPLRAALGLTVVPPGGSRIFTLPVPADFAPTGPITTVIKYDPLAKVQ